MKWSREYREQRDLGNDQAHFVCVKMPAICGMRSVMVRSNDNSAFMRTDPTNE
jgi:hypothetical protein